MRQILRLSTAVLVTLALGRLDAQTVAIVGGTVYPVSGPKIESGTVLIRDGRIAAVGPAGSVTVPSGARVIDARGQWVTPGFINAATTLGLSEAGSPQFSGGYNDASARGSNGITAGFDAWRGINPASTLFGPARSEGVTTVVVAPNGGMVAGRIGVIDLVQASTAGEMLRRGNVAMLGNFGSPGSGNAASRAEFWADWRALLDDAKAYAQRRAQYESGATREFAAPRADLEALVPVATGQLPLALAVDRASDILEALSFAKENGLKLWLLGAAEGWVVAKEIAAANVPVMVGAMNNIPVSFDALSSAQENAALLRAAGVTVVLIGNGPGDNESFNVRNIRQEAGNAVAYGMSWDDALRAITLAPAQVLGVADRIGTLEAGKDANVAIWSGDPFEFSSTTAAVFIRGREFTEPSRQQQLLERYRTLPAAPYRP